MATTARPSTSKTKYLPPPLSVPVVPLGESGQVTLDGDDRKVEHQYQTWFDSVPQVTYGLCGFNFDLDAKQDPVSHGNGYGGHRSPPKEPNAVGIRINAFSSKVGLTVEGFDFSFGDTYAATADVCFQACSIGPGPGPVDH